MKYCPDCGYQLEGKPKFCPDCGKKLSLETIESKTEKSEPSIVNEPISPKKPEITQGNKTEREISFEKEIDIKATEKKLTEFGFAEVWEPYRHPIFIFDKQKTIKEIRKVIIEDQQHPIIFRTRTYFILFGMFIGALMGVSLYILSRYTPILLLLYFIIVFIILLYIILELRELRKYIYFPTPNRVVFWGRFTEDEINYFTKSIIWKKSLVKNKEKNE